MEHNMLLKDKRTGISENREPHDEHFEEQCSTSLVPTGRGDSALSLPLSHLNSVLITSANSPLSPQIKASRPTAKLMNHKTARITIKANLAHISLLSVAPTRHSAAVVHHAAVKIRSIIQRIDDTLS